MRPLIRSLAALVLFTSSSAFASTLTYVNRSADSERRLTLRRHGDRLVIVDDRSRTVVAGAPAAETQHVVVQGARGRHDDTLTIDLSVPFSLPGGIDYDGGEGGWDVLAIRGGAVAHETVTQRSPHDGTFDLDGLLIRYTNLEPTSDTVAAATLTIVGTAGDDTVTIADGPGVGEATISSPTFESVTFANKTTVTFDGNGGNHDTFDFNNPTPAAGLTTFLVTNVFSVSQSAPVHYHSLGVHAGTPIGSGAIGLGSATNDVTNIELVNLGSPDPLSPSGIFYGDMNDVTIGGVSPSLSGVRTVNSGTINFTAGGTITLADTDGPDIVHAASGPLFMQAFGSGDIVATVNNPTFTAVNGAVRVFAGRDLLLGNGGPNYDNSISASTSVNLGVSRDVLITGATNVKSGPNDFVSVIAPRDLLLSGSTLGAIGTGSGFVTIRATGSLTLTDATVAAASAGNVNIVTDRLILQGASSITASGGSIFVSAFSVPIDLGSTTDVAAAVEISNAELNAMHAPAVVLESANIQNLTVTQPIAFGGSLTLRSMGTFSGAGTGSLSAPAITFDDLGFAPRTWTNSATALTISPGAPIPFSGLNTLFILAKEGDDTFNLTPLAATTLDINGGNQFDTLNVSTAGTTAPYLAYSSDLNGYFGAYTFGNRQPVNFYAIESLSPASTDLAITKDDGSPNAVAGGTVTYTIVASNLGPLGLSGVNVVDTFPPSLSNIHWTCTASPGSACNPGGSGGNQLANLAVGGTATYIVTATLDPLRQAR